MKVVSGADRLSRYSDKKVGYASRRGNDGCRRKKHIVKAVKQMEVLFGILIPFIGTALGSACVFFMKRSLGDLVSREFKSGQFEEGSNAFVNNL